VTGPKAAGAWWTLILLVRRRPKLLRPGQRRARDRVRRRRRRNQRAPHFELAQSLGINNTDTQIVVDQTFATDATNDMPQRSSPTPGIRFTRVTSALRNRA
jgi:hypothetical protein